MQITELLQRVHEGDKQALDSLIPLVYEELKKLARAQLRREWNKPIETTVLVHEAFLRLARGQHPSYENRTHFYGIASRLMRQVLVDTARAASAGKRSALETVVVRDLSEASRQPDRSVLALDDALGRLEQLHPMKAQLVEMKYFGGMTADESAVVLGIPVSTVRRELRLAQAWLQKELAG